MLITASTTPGNTAETVIRAAIAWLQRLRDEETEMFTESWQFYEYLDLDGRDCFTDRIMIDDDKLPDLTMVFSFVKVVLYLKFDSDPELILACYKLAILGMRPETIGPHPTPLSESEQAAINSKKIGLTHDAGTLDELRAKQAGN